MTLKLKLLCRVVRRRVERGEELTEVLKDYPKLTEEQREEIVASPFCGGAPLFLSRHHETRRFMEFAFHFLEKCATLDKTEHGSADR